MEPTSLIPPVQHSAEPSIAATSAIVDVLYVDGDETEFLMLQRACECGGARFNFRFTRSAAEAVSMLSQGQARLPRLILFEVMAENQERLELLRYIRCQPRLKDIPVIAYTWSRSPAVLARTREAGAWHIIPQGDSRLAAARLRKIVGISDTRMQRA